MALWGNRCSNIYSALYDALFRRAAVASPSTGVQRVTAEITDLKGALEIVEQQEIFSPEEELTGERDATMLSLIIPRSPSK
jgi:hypothetical protein